jgi:hypothetical protein
MRREIEAVCKVTDSLYDDYRQFIDSDFTIV